RWRELHRQVYQSVRSHGVRPGMLARVCERQRRGVLHVHPVFAYTTPAERYAARLYVRYLAELAPRWGFGHVDRRYKPMPRRAAAAYLSSYFVTGKKTKASLQESAMAPDMPQSIIHVSTQLTQRTRS